MTPVTEREVVATFVSYPQAQGALDHLASKGFPRDCITIVGDDLRCIEGSPLPPQRAGGLSGAADALVTAGVGTAVAALLTAAGIASDATALLLAVAAYVVGSFLALAGVRALRAAATRRRRPAPTIRRMSARSYWVTCEALFAEEAMDLLRNPQSSGGMKTSATSSSEGTTAVRGRRFARRAQGRRRRD